MKKVLVILGFAMFTLGIAVEKSAAATTEVSATKEGEKREKIAVDSLPAAVLQTWKASPNAAAKVKETVKVTKETGVIFEVFYTDSKGGTSVAKFKADGTEVK